MKRHWMSSGHDGFAILFSTQAEIAFYDSRIVCEFGRLALQYDLARFQDIAVIGDLQSRSCVLLDKQNGDPCAAQTPDNVKDFPNNTGRKAKAGLVQHQQLRLSHQCAA